MLMLAYCAALYSQHRCIKTDSVNQRALETYPEITVNCETRGSASLGLKVIKTTKTDPQLP